MDFAFYRCFKLLRVGVEKKGEIGDGQNKQANIDGEKAPLRPYRIDKIGDVNKLGNYAANKSNPLYVLFYLFNCYFRLI